MPFWRTSGPILAKRANRRIPAGDEALLRLHLHIGSWRIAEHLELTVAGFASGYFRARQLRQPRVPIGPPRARVFDSTCLPLLDGWRQLVVGPILIFVRRRRI